MLKMVNEEWFIKLGLKEEQTRPWVVAGSTLQVSPKFAEQMLQDNGGLDQFRESVEDKKNK